MTTDPIFSEKSELVVAQVVVPDRYESLARRAGSQLNTIVERVDEGLSVIDRIFTRMERADRGAFLILRGASGAGKSTFLHTVGIFRKGVATVSVPGGASIRGFLQAHKPTGAEIEILVLEEREAAVSFSDAELEDWLHAVNGFIRSSSGRRALVVWPCNSDALRDRLVSLADAIGGEALLGTGEKFVVFEGPAKDKYVGIAEKTLATLNQGATFSDLGLTTERVQSAADGSNTIGGFLARVHDRISDAEDTVRTLVKQEQCRLWVVVAAGNSPDADVAGLTRGAYAAIDTERLMSSTEANIVSELKKQPDRIGVLGTVLDAKILHLPVLTASAIARSFADEGLSKMLKERAFSLAQPNQNDAKERLLQSDLGIAFKSGTQGLRSRGKKPGSESVESFRKLADIASKNDAALNRAIGRALVHAGLIDSFEVEQDFGSGLTRRTDILAQTASGPTRIEVMWRRTTSRADIANYTLTKVANYGRAIGFLD